MYVELTRPAYSVSTNKMDDLNLEVNKPIGLVYFDSEVNKKFGDGNSSFHYFQSWKF